MKPTLYFNKDQTTIQLVPSCGDSEPQWNEVALYEIPPTHKLVPIEPDDKQIQSIVNGVFIEEGIEEDHWISLTHDEARQTYKIGIETAPELEDI